MISRKLFSVVISLLSLFHISAIAGFDWGTTCDGGSGSFQQQVVYYNGDLENTATVGTIPSGLTNITISLASAQDIDIRLYDASGTKIVHWPNGVLSSASKSQTTYNGVVVEYSGYNGDGVNVGNEYIKITGTTQNAFVMKVFGYKAGYAQVNYSWSGKANCNSSQSTSRKSNSFQQTLNKNALVYLGTIPAGIENPAIFLNANNDLDIQLFDERTGAFVLGWNSPYIDSAGFIRGLYNTDIIEWSGWNGRNQSVSKDVNSGISISKELGREYIRIKGVTKNSYKMYVYAYAAGSAAIEYSWGPNTIYAGILGQGIGALGHNSTADANMYAFSAKLGVMPDFYIAHGVAKDVGERSAAYGHTVEQVTSILQGRDLFGNGSPARGQIGIAIKMSNYSRGAGDFNVYTSGNIDWVFNKIKKQITESSNNQIFISGHSSGGGDAQDMLWLLNTISTNVVASFQIDSVENEIRSGTFEPLLSGDARIPPNTANAFNYWEDNVWYTTFGPREASIYADDSLKTKITNTKIVNPTCNSDGNGNCSQDAHEAIDNDSRVYNDILNSIRQFAGITSFFFD